MSIHLSKDATNYLKQQLPYLARISDIFSLNNFQPKYIGWEPLLGRHLMIISATVLNDNGPVGHKSEIYKFGQNIKHLYN